MKLILKILIILIILIVMNYFNKYLKYKNKYIKLKTKEQFGGNNKNLWILENFFSKEEFNYITKYFSNLKLKNDPRSGNRQTLCINPKKHQDIYNYIYKNKKFLKLINHIKNPNHYIKNKPSYPIEYRKYFTGSQGMPWHIDTSLFKPDCFEIVLTLTNNSDSKFEWFEDNKVKSISPKENTLVIVRPESVKHRVTSVNHGERTILKFIIEFIENGKTDNIKKDNFTYELEACPF